MSSLYKYTLELRKTLRGFVFIAMVGIAALVFLGATLASSLLYERLLETRNQETTAEIAQQHYNLLYQALRQGGSHQQIETLIADSQRAFPSTLEKIEIHRSAALSSATATPLPADIAQALRTGKPDLLKTPEYLLYLFPVAAEASCLQCHQNVQTGDVLGLIAIQHKLQTITTTVRIYYIALFLTLGTLVLLIAAALTSFIARKLNQSIEQFRAKVDAFNNIKDFEHLQIDRGNFGFEELNQTFDSLSLLVEKIKAVAVDKSVLEFEIRLLEKFIITSNVVRDWRQFIKALLLDINQIIDAYALVTIFRIEEEAYECEIFWRNTPTATTIELFEKILRKQLHDHPLFHDSTLVQIAHNISDDSVVLPELTLQDVELQTKTLLLDTPRIGGIVGIGVQSMLTQDNVRYMVIGSILTTLLNLVGSVKAIYKYTKDLEHYATRDPLTDLYNQRMFWELLGYEVGRSRRHKQTFAVLMLDLDNFKTVNDRFGHPQGDALLQELAALLHTAVRDGDLLARYGGDEFCVILPEADDTQAHLVAQRIIDALDHFSLHTPGGHKIKTTTSIGIAISPQHGDNPKDLFLVADNMLYKAKQAGKNCIAIPNEDEMAEVFRKAGEKSIMIQNALDQGHIVPYFQPISCAANGEIVIHELLMRIQVDGQIVAANDFIVQAESMGIAHKMDYQLIEKAFIQIKEQNYSGMLFVNISPKALIVGEFVARLSQLAKQFAIEPGRIVFEITERETVSNLSLLEKFVLDVKLQGFSFAIDDFGSGYSSFQYIKHFPVDYIKIEGEFVRNILNDDVYLAFVKSIVTLAKALNIKTIAEFVEDAAILEAISALGIDYAQGYHISRPSPKLHIA